MLSHSGPIFNELLYASFHTPDMDFAANVSALAHFPSPSTSSILPSPAASDMLRSFLVRTWRKDLHRCLSHYKRPAGPCAGVLELCAGTRHGVSQSRHLIS